MNSEEYLSVLNPEQRAAVVHEGSPLLILAGAGSGKTRVITTKIAYLISEKNIPAYQILAVTFTKKAAREMADRAVKLESRSSEAQIRTFHSFGAWFLRKFSDEAGVDKNFTVYDDDDMVTLVSKAVPSLSRQEASKAAHKIALAKDYCLLPDSKELSTIESSAEFPSIYAAYEERLRSTGNVDFGDLIMLPVLVLQKNDNVRTQMQYRFRVIMVDEYQDSNVAQFKLLETLSGVKEGSGTYVCVVGDDDQSIYRFRGAEVQNILSFQQEFPGTQLIRLERNYRSTSQILNAADKVVQKNENRLGKTLVAERGEGSKPVLIFCPTQDDETQMCANLIQQAREKGCPYSDWAILYRMNAQSLGFETELLRRKIPYTVIGSLKFYEREEIKDVLAFLALVANPRDEIAFRRIVNKPVHGVGNKTQDNVVEFARSENANSLVPTSLIDASRTYGKSLSKKAKDGLNDFANMMDEFASFIGIDEAFEEENEVFEDQEKTEAQEKPKAQKKSVNNLSLFIKKVAERSGLIEYHKSQDEIAGTQRVANIDELANNAVLYENSRKGLLDFLDAIELDRTLAEATDTEQADSVTLITLHNTKGLEFPRVIITGLESGIFPRQDKTGSDLEEERRLFYVGITRAKDQLYITSCSVRRLYGRVEYMKPSPFLMEAGKDVFSVIGKKPSSYQAAMYSESDFADGSENPDDENAPVAAKWKKGLKVFHDDYGYGQIIKAQSSSGEYVITVQFENGGSKQFIPKYQSNSLMIVKD